MQIWLPHPNFVKSARSLRNKELGRQRVDIKQILNALLLVRPSAWKVHPCARMWRGYENKLLHYYNTTVSEWKRRGHKHTMELDPVVTQLARRRWADVPWWWDQFALHESHRAALIRRHDDYRKEFPDIFEAMPMIWPIRRDGKKNTALKPYNTKESEGWEDVIPF